VIRGADGATAYIDGTVYSVAGVIGYSRERDVAVLGLAGAGHLPTINLAQSTALQVGDSVLSISSPLGVFQNSLSTGVVSGIRQGGTIQMTAPISHGSSGSPVFDQHGNAIGIAEATAPAGENLNLAIPISAALPFIEGRLTQTLGDVLIANETSVPFLSRQVIVPARKMVTFQLTINPNLMSYAALIGDFESSGGAGGLAEMLVLRGGEIVFRTGRVQQQTVNVNLAPGTYSVAFDNGPSLIFSRNIVANLQLRYVQ
jgi:S1-C subfamily serine protease